MLKLTVARGAKQTLPMILLQPFHTAACPFSILLLAHAVPSQSPASWTAMFRIQLRCQWGSGLERKFSAIKLLLLAGKDSKWQLLGGVLFHTRHVPVACPKCPVLVSAGRDGTCRGVRGVSSAQHFYIKLGFVLLGTQTPEPFQLIPYVLTAKCLAGL